MNTFRHSAPLLPSSELDHAIVVEIPSTIHIRVLPRSHLMISGNRRRCVVAGNRNVCGVTLLFDQVFRRNILNWQGERLPSNLTNGEWARLGPLIPAASPGGQPRKTDMRAAMNAILYLPRTGCPWRYLPRDGLPPHSTGPEHRPQIPGRWGVRSDLDGVAHGASRTPWAGCQPNRRRVRQPVTEVGKGSGKDDAVGYDTAKTVMGHKVHAQVDAEGLRLRVIIHSAAIQDSDGAALVIDKIRSR